MSNSEVIATVDDAPCRRSKATKSVYIELVVGGLVRKVEPDGGGFGPRHPSVPWPMPVVRLLTPVVASNRKFQRAEVDPRVAATNYFRYSYDVIAPSPELRTVDPAVTHIVFCSEVKTVSGCP